MANGDREADLFREAMSDVDPIDHDRHMPEIHYRPPVSISQLEREVLRELDALVQGEGELVLHDPSDYQDAKVPGLDPRTMKQLRRGEFTVQADLDLHGKDAETARTLVERFIVDAQARGLRCLRIVHGRGRGPQADPAALAGARAGALTGPRLLLGASPRWRRGRHLCPASPWTERGQPGGMIPEASQLS